MTQLIEKTIIEIRLLSVELHPPALTTLGFLPALKSYLKLYTSTFGVLVDLESTGVEKQLPEQSSVAVFRVCQEALTNIAKHADTSDVKMSLQWNEAELKISIVDFGGGFAVDELEDEHGFVRNRCNEGKNAFNWRTLCNIL